jgi:hypothetical protein
MVEGDDKVRSRGAKEAGAWTGGGGDDAPSRAGGQARGG